MVSSGGVEFHLTLDTIACYFLPTEKHWPSFQCECLSYLAPRPTPPTCRRPSRPLALSFDSTPVKYLPFNSPHTSSASTGAAPNLDLVGNQQILGRHAKLLSLLPCLRVLLDAEQLSTHINTHVHAHRHCPHIGFLLLPPSRLLVCVW